MNIQIKNLPAFLRGNFYLLRLCLRGLFAIKSATCKTIEANSQSIASPQINKKLALSKVPLAKCVQVNQVARAIV